MDSNTSLWRTYLFIIMASMMAAGGIIYIEWTVILKDAKNELVYTNRLLASSIQSSFHKNEGLLKILGERLVDLGVLTQPSDQAKKLVDELLQNNSDLAGIGFATPSGQLVLTSFNIDRSQLPNLLQSAESSITFKQALKSDQMILGHVYFMRALQEWIIPLRFRILDAVGNVTAVMTTGLKINSKDNLWSDVNLPKHIKTQVLRKDYYYLYSPIGLNQNLEEIYAKPINPEYVDKLSKSGETYTFSGKQGALRIPVLYSISYNQRYEIYTLLSTTYSLLYQKLYLSITLVITILLIYLAVLFWVFNGIIRLQINSKKRLKFQATHDTLTRLPNRRYLINEFLQWQQKCNHKFHLIFIDLNHFKSSNDLYGHSIGDLILKEVAVRLKAGFPDCLITRHGGDEFIILSSNLSSSTLLGLCEFFLEQLTLPIVLGDLEFSIGASVGVTHSPSDGTELDELQRKADMAMYEAKRGGADIVMFSPQLEDAQKHKVMIERELRHALERKEFYLVYQPQVDSISQKFIGAEVLIRWKNKNLGLVSPDEFIPIAEAAGLIIDIGKFVLENSIIEFSMLSERINANRKYRLSINISVFQLMHNRFIKDLKEICDKHQSPKISIVLEVTESLFIDDLEKVRFILNEVKKLGMDISLDDFGTGYSSLSILSHLTINELKIDKSFVRDILTDINDRNLIEGIINLSQSLKIPVIAEGVEEKAQADLLYGFGCDLFQGYYYSKPLSLTDLSHFIKNNGTTTLLDSQKNNFKMS